jgi:catalase (peroxidase I)
LAISEVKKLKTNGNHITNILSISDLIQLGGYAAVEYCGGPQMVFRMGREILKNEDDSVPHNKETFFNSLNVDRLSKLNLKPEDYVALIGGS